MIRIAVDLMGGDRPVRDLIPAVLRCIDDFPSVSLTLVGDSEAIESALLTASATGSRERLAILRTEDVVLMSDKPSVALRKKRSSSMGVSLKLVQQKSVDACVSAGNTGALMAFGLHLLKTVPGIDRPAIIKAFPSTRGRCYLLDLGANIHCDAANLVQFAAMGSLMCGAVEGIDRPTVGLLNIGQEETKGEDSVRLAAQLLRQNDRINFIGFVEGDGIYQSDADVLVCDGRVGNIALKTSEGLAKFVYFMIERAFARNLATRAAAVVSDSVLKQLKAELRPENYNGATLLGLDGIVVKSHGKSSAEGFYHAIREAIRSIEQNIPALLNARLVGILGT